VTWHRTTPWTVSRTGRVTPVKRRKESQSNRAVARRPPDYVIVVAPSDWAKEHDPANRFNLWDTLHAGKDPHPNPEPEPDLEAEP
jgi:hypothetical protein